MIFPMRGHGRSMRGLNHLLMTFNDIELYHHEKELERFLELHRPPVDRRDQCDIGYRITGQSVEIFELHPDWQDNTRMVETPAAKATFVRRTNRWRVYWMKRDLRWHGYEPAPEVASLEAFLDLVHHDAYSCFWG